MAVKTLDLHEHLRSSRLKILPLALIRMLEFSLEKAWLIDSLLLVKIHGAWGTHLCRLPTCETRHSEERQENIFVCSCRTVNLFSVK